MSTDHGIRNRMPGVGKLKVLMTAILAGGVPLITLVSCDPNSHAFNLVRINDLDDIIEDVLDSDLVEDYFDHDYDDDYYDDDYYDHDDYYYDGYIDVGWGDDGCYDCGW
ncbi:MAG: hypothetical protein ACYTHJ_20695 [Planctomycetota bacterium]|jgi:hypothetical protein